MSFTEHYYTQFEFDNFYHIYNRGIDKKALFMDEGNYLFFLKKYQQYLWPVVETVAYCLMGNHFHFIIKIRSEDALAVLPEKPERFVVVDSNGPAWKTAAPDLTTFGKLSNLGGSNPTAEPAVCHNMVYPQFRKLFQSYAMAFNKQQNRCGTLFQTPFKRALIDDENYLRQAIRYVHKNPVQHGITDHIQSWPWSSYHLFDKHSGTNRWLMQDTVPMLFGNADNFRAFHGEMG
jgi:REP element-mobilizing transposase RayT